MKRTIIAIALALAAAVSFGQDASVKSAQHPFSSIKSNLTDPTKMCCFKCCNNQPPIYLQSTPKKG